MIPRVRLVVLLVLLALGALSIGGCSTVDVSSDDIGVEAGGRPQAMPTDARDALPEGFPIEVPAMDALVTDVSTSDMDVGPWVYVMESPHDSDAIAAWYQQAYTGRSWQVADEATGETEHVLVMTKGAGAWSTVRVQSVDDGSRIECWTGIGVPMPREALPSAGASEV